MSSKDLRQEGLAFNSGNCFQGRKKKLEKIRREKSKL